MIDKKEVFTLSLKLDEIKTLKEALEFAMVLDDHVERIKKYVDMHNIITQLYNEALGRRT